jgi:hypothetical protein
MKGSKKEHDYIVYIYIDIDGVFSIAMVDYRMVNIMSHTQLSKDLGNS